jgi:hypothetical protein
MKRVQGSRESNDHRGSFKSVSNFGDDGLQIDDKQLFDGRLDVFMNVAVCEYEGRNTEHEAACHLDDTRVAECPCDTTDSVVSPDKISGCSFAIESRSSDTSGNCEMTLLRNYVRAEDFECKKC